MNPLAKSTDGKPKGVVKKSIEKFLCFFCVFFGMGRMRKYKMQLRAEFPVFSLNPKHPKK